MSVVVAEANPSVMIFVPVARLLTVSENDPEVAELVVVMSTTLLESDELLLENSPLLTMNRLSVFSVVTTLLKVWSLLFNSRKLASFCSSIILLASTRSMGRACRDTSLLMMSSVSRLELMPNIAVAAMR